VNAEDLDRLARRTQGGDKRAFVELLAGVQREVRIFLSAHATSADMVDEVLQAAFVACYENLHKYEPRGTFLPWLKSIARNLLLKELKERARYVAVEGDALEELLIRRSLEAMSATGREDSVRRLEECLGKLEPPSRKLIDERYALKRSVAELARSYGRTESWVAVTLFRIRRALHACLTRSEPAL
jgi:RNA polymerase sigma-70 factor (ECF subfamily)